MRSTVAGHGKLTTTNWEDHQSWSSYKEVAKELNVNHLMVIQHLMQTGKVKNLSKWVPHELTENQKHCHFEVTSLILCNNKEPFLDWIVMYNEKCTLYNNWWWPSQCLDWKEAPKHFPKPNLHPKRSWSLFGGLLPIWSTKAFWIPVKPLHLRGMLSKSMSHTENYNACSQYRSTQGTQCFCTTMLNHTLHNQHFKSWVNWATHFCHIHLTSCQPTTTSSNISTAFCKENASTTSRRQKMLSKSSLNLEAQIFMLQE